VVSWLRRARLWASLRRTPREAAPLPVTQAPELLGCVAEPPPSLAALTTPQLCALWRKSRAGLRAAPTPAARAEVVHARGVILDELERREPHAMAEWLESGALEPDGPSAYLVRSS
jgi:hypothetical protein